MRSQHAANLSASTEVYIEGLVKLAYILGNQGHLLWSGNTRDIHTWVVECYLVYESIRLVLQCAAILFVGMILRTIWDPTSDGWEMLRCNNTPRPASHRHCPSFDNTSRRLPA